MMKYSIVLVLFFLTFASFSLPKSYLRLEYAKDYINSGDYEKAIKEIKNFLSFPREKGARVEAYKLLAICYERLFLYSKAARYYELLFSMGESVEFYLKAGKLYMLAGDMEKAKYIFEYIVSNYKENSKFYKESKFWLDYLKTKGEG